MAQNSKIEWTDTTWNPVTGCTKVSAGCDHCYAETLHERFNGKGSFATVTLHPERLDMPHRWRKPRRVFVNSMSDLFHDDVPDEYIARIFHVMATSPAHTFQILTKRHGRMRSLLNSSAFVRSMLDNDRRTGFGTSDGVLDKAAQQFMDSPRWPLANVWLGVSTEDQKWADIRIPALLDTPAAVRWISAEPLLGPIDLTKWMPPVSPMDPTSAPKTWAEWTWPDWVPAAIREPVEKFWLERWGRGPHAWMHNMHEQGAPAFGAEVTLDDGFGPNPAKTSGRYVHAWNNIGRIVHDDGTFSYTSFGPRAVRENQRLNWVVTGGESGPGARPMHPQWARSLRDQSAAAGVPFLFKQFGAWKPVGEGIGPFALPEMLIGPPLDEWGHRQIVRRVGKARAGRELDGRTWDEYPTGVA